MELEPSSSVHGSAVMRSTGHGHMTLQSMLNLVKNPSHFEAD